MRAQRRKTRLGIVFNKREVSPKELLDHRMELQVKRNRALRLKQESLLEEKKRKEGNDTALSMSGVFAHTEMATGTFYSIQSTNTGPVSQWQKNG